MYIKVTWGVPSSPSLKIKLILFSSQHILRLLDWTSQKSQVGTISNYILFVLNHTYPQLCAGEKWIYVLCDASITFQKYVLRDASITFQKYLLLLPCLLFSKLHPERALIYIYVCGVLSNSFNSNSVAAPVFHQLYFETLEMEKRRGPPYPTSIYDTSHQQWKMQRAGHYTQHQVIWNLLLMLN